MRSLTVSYLTAFVLVAVCGNVGAIAPGQPGAPAVPGAPSAHGVLPHHHHDHLVNLEFSPEVEFPDVNIANADQKQNQHGRRGQTSGPRTPRRRHQILGSKFNVGPDVPAPDLEGANGLPSQEHNRRGLTHVTGHHAHGDVVHGDVVGKVKDTANVNAANAEQSQNQRREYDLLGAAIRGDLKHAANSKRDHDHDHDAVILADILALIKESGNVNMANAQQSQNQHGRRNGASSHSHGHDVAHADVVAIVKDTANVNMANAHQTQDQHAKRCHDEAAILAEIVALIKGSGNVNIANADQSQNQHAKRCHDEAAILAEIVALIKGSGNINIANAEQSQNQHAKRCHDDALILAEIVALIKGSGNINLANAQQSQNQHAKRCLDDAVILAEIVALIKGSGNFNIANAQQSQNQHGRRDVAHADIVAAIEDLLSLNIANAKQTQNQAKRFLDPAALDFLSKPSGLSSKRGVDANGVDNTHTATSVPGLLFEATVKIGPLCDKLLAAIRANIDVGVSVEIVHPIFDELKIELQYLFGGLQTISTNPGHDGSDAEGMYYAGRIVPLSEVAIAVASLFKTIITTLGAVLVGARAAERSIIQGLITQVAVQLAQVLSAVFTVNVRLQALAVPLFTSVKDTILYLNLASVFEHFGIQY